MIVNDGNGLVLLDVTRFYTRRESILSSLMLFRRDKCYYIQR
mgnify:FL=1